MTGKTLPARPRPGHLELAQHRLRRATAASSRWRSASSGRSIRSPAGSSTTRARSGSRSWRRRARRWPRPASAAGDIAAIGITNQRETTLLWNRSTGEPIANAIVWQDRRTAPAVRGAAQRGLEPLFREKTGLVIDAYFSGTKLALAARQRARRARRGRARRARLRHRRQLADVELTGGATRRRAPRPRHRRRATPRARCCSTSTHDAWERRAARAARRSRATLLPEVQPSSHVYGHTEAGLLGAADRRSAASPATSRARCSARPASRPGR